MRPANNKIQFLIPNCSAIKVQSGVEEQKDTRTLLELEQGLGAELYFN